MIKKILSLTLLAVSLAALPSAAQSTPAVNNACAKTECKATKNTETGCDKKSTFSTSYNCDEVYNLSSQVKIDNDKPQFRKIFTGNNGTAILLALKAEQAIGTHAAPEDVMVYVLEGDIEFTTPEKVNRIKTGEFLLLRADVPHGLKALADSKLTIVKVRP